MKYDFEVEIDGINFEGTMYYNFIPAKLSGAPEDCYPEEFDLDYITCEGVWVGDGVYLSTESSNALYNDYAEDILQEVLDGFR
jgi:hypothetical protein